MNLKTWEDQCLQEVLAAEDVLHRRLGDNQASVESQMDEAEALYPRMTSMLAELDALLDVEMWRMLPVKNQMSEQDRHLAVMAHTAPIRRQRDRVKGLVAAAEQRVTTCQCKLKLYTKEYEIIQREAKRK